ncbi:MAG: dihydrolipoamide dehydrogenase [Alphaproteobacteria bacterium]|nr:MAG: dihydrolipoamide dehydrogenase [Alphaproteobacteria bacterium]
MENIKADIAIIGAGSAGLVAASGAARLGQKVVLFESGEMGGDCLNYGCVPSKSLIAAARAAEGARSSGPLGIDAGPLRVDWARISAHVHGVIETIAPIDSQERFEGLGVRVVRERARFADARTIVSDSVSVRARIMVIAAGARAGAPPIPGLGDVPYLTNETIFEIAALPGHLLIVGAGAIGLELGQAFRRLGADVTIIEAGQILGGSDDEAAAVLRAKLTSEGVTLLETTKIERIEGVAGAIVVHTAGEGVRRIVGTHLLIAAGRKPNVENLGLEAAGVAHDKRGVTTDAYLRTSNKRIYALGDIASREQFTHAAGLHGSLFVRNALFKLSPGRADGPPIPRVIYTEPEYAAVGISEKEARARWGDAVRVLSVPMHDNDRAQTERDTYGFARIIVRSNGEIVGAVIVGAHAGETIATVALAIANKLKIAAFTSSFVPAYPTRAEVLKRAAGQFYTESLFSPRTKMLVRLLTYLP